MPEIKIKHVVSFSSEDKVHKAENLIKPETYRKWKCATPGEKSATVALQFEKATQIHSIDIGNESSAFVEVLVGRSSGSVKDFQVLLVASSFMSPIESRNGTHTNRVRMFGPEKLSQNTKDEKWDCVQVVCTQPFNKTTTYGLSFIKFHSPPEKISEQPQSLEAEKTTSKLGAFRLKMDDDDDEDLPAIGSWFGKQKSKDEISSSLDSSGPSYAAAILASSSSSQSSPQNNTQKRKIEETSSINQGPPAKKTPPAVLNKDHIVYKDVLRGAPESTKSDTSKDAKKNLNNFQFKKTSDSSALSKPSTGKQKVSFDKIMDKVIFVLSGFVNPLRSELRDKALDMGAKYKPDWDSSCTHLVCAFTNTPKYEQVKKLNGRIVSKQWILDCYKKKEPLLYRTYALAEPSEDSESCSEDSEPSTEGFSEAEDSEDEYVPEKKKKKKKDPFPTLPIKTDAKVNLIRKNTQPSTPSTSTDPKRSSDTDEGNRATPNKKDDSSIFSKLMGSNHKDKSQPPAVTTRDESETEDEDALQDYAADTDKEDSGREDEFQRLKKIIKEDNSREVNGSRKASEILEKPDVTDLPLPELPNIFKGRRFFLYGKFPSSNSSILTRYITAYNGVIESYMGENVKYVISNEKWDKNFEDALSENDDLIFVKPTWIFKCHEAKKFVPFQPYIITPDS